MSLYRATENDPFLKGDTIKNTHRRQRKDGAEVNRGSTCDSFTYLSLVTERKTEWKFLFEEHLANLWHLAVECAVGHLQFMWHKSNRTGQTQASFSIQPEVVSTALFI